MDILMTFTTALEHRFKLQVIVDLINEISLESSFKFVVTDSFTKNEITDILPQTDTNEIDPASIVKVEPDIKIKKEVIDDDSNGDGDKDNFIIENTDNDNENEVDNDQVVKEEDDDNSEYCENGAIAKKDLILKPKKLKLRLKKKKTKVKIKVKEELDDNDDAELDENGKRKKKKRKYVKKAADGNFKCDKCGKKYTVEKYFRTHECIDAVCDICGKSGFPSLSNHKNWTHNKKRTRHTCPYCQKEVTNIDVHIKTVHHKIKEHQCHQCGQSFLQKNNLKKHIKIDHEGLQRNIECDICGKKYYFMYELRNHQKISHKEGGNPCEYCDKNLSTEMALKIHVITQHTDMAPYKCEYCKKGFMFEKELKDHEKSVHIKSYDYSCQHCGKLFTGKRQRNNHVRDYHMESYRCNICGEEQKSGPMLVQHQNIHMKKYQCKQCHLCFGKPFNLKMHMTKCKVYASPTPPAHPQPPVTPTSPNVPPPPSSIPNTAHHPREESRPLVPNASIIPPPASPV